MKKFSDEEIINLARSVAVETAGSEEQVGGVLEPPVEIESDVFEYRFAVLRKGYEGWFWSVTLYFDKERGRWTINESVMLPSSKALMAPQWIPWKDRLRPQDIAVTDRLGTDPQDSRIQDNLLDHRTSTAMAAENLGGMSADIADDVDDTAENVDDVVNVANDTAKHRDHDSAIDPEDNDFQDLDLSVDQQQQDGDDPFKVAAYPYFARRHSMSDTGRSETAQRWYEGPHGPKSLSTLTAKGHHCSACAFFLPLQGQLGSMFGACANRWSPDDGRVVSLDHGCGEHSEIEPPEPSRLWVQSEPTYDDMHIDILHQVSRDESAQVEMIEESVSHRTRKRAVRRRSSER